MHKEYNLIGILLSFMNSYIAIRIYGGWHLRIENI